MTPEQFSIYKAQGFNRIPLVKQVLADLDTPLSAYLKLADGDYSYLLESVQGGEKWGRYSIIGLPSKTVVSVVGYDVTVKVDANIVETETVKDPLEWVENYLARYKVPEIPGLPRTNGGLVGYFAYDTVRYIEPRLAAGVNPDPLGTPDILLMLSEELVVFDNLSGKLFVIVHVDPADVGAYDNGHARIDALIQHLQNDCAVAPSSQLRAVEEQDFESAFPQDKFESAVDTIKKYIVEGDTMQVVLSQRMSVDYHAAPLDLYRALRCLNPSPYMYFFNFKGFHVVGSSPEILVRLQDNEIAVRPIAGTRPRGHTEAEDVALEAELLADPKEIAEHLMLIDLGRNDVGRVADVGTVKLTDKMIVERYSHVMHIVSNVTGQVSDKVSAMDVLRATFPAGTLSGAPKIRAMEIIDDLEPVKRGIYGGAVGYLSWAGDMDTAIAIRTAVIKDNKLYIQAGAGIVADSVPLKEWEETLNKGRAIFRAVKMAESGLGVS
ncbi:MAG: anthranilate synthase component I [Methylococcales bacterium]|jgi:anthranilate synthase component I|nr:anthranilate synthase component I [Methylococcales bacterium]MBT7444071.1 anthranilate synthase component I [Methylococcales bacterium]